MLDNITFLAPEDLPAALRQAQADHANRRQAR